MSQSSFMAMMLATEPVKVRSSTQVRSVTCGCRVTRSCVERDEHIEHFATAAHENQFQFSANGPAQLSTGRSQVRSNRQGIKNRSDLATQGSELLRTCCGHFVQGPASQLSGKLVSEVFGQEIQKLVDAGCLAASGS